MYMNSLRLKPPLREIDFMVAVAMKEKCSNELCHWINFTSFFFLRFIYLFLERGEGKEKERERNINVWLPLARPLLETWPTAQACVLTGNWTSDPLVHRSVLRPLSHTSQGSTLHLEVCHHSLVTLSTSLKVSDKYLVISVKINLFQD